EPDPGTRAHARDRRGHPVSEGVRRESRDGGDLSIREPPLQKVDHSGLARGQQRQRLLFAGLSSRTRSCVGALAEYEQWKDGVEHRRHPSEKAPPVVPADTGKGQPAILAFGAPARMTYRLTPTAETKFH